MAGILKGILQCRRTIDWRSFMSSSLFSVSSWLSGWSHFFRAFLRFLFTVQCSYCFSWKYFRPLFTSCFQEALSVPGCARCQCQCLFRSPWHLWNTECPYSRIGLTRLLYSWQNILWSEMVKRSANDPHYPVCLGWDMSHMLFEWQVVVNSVTCTNLFLLLFRLYSR